MSPRSPHVPACLQGTLLCKVPALRPPSVWTFHGRTRQISYPHLSHRPNLCQSAATSTSTVSIASSKNGFHPDKQLIQIKRLCDIVINSIKKSRNIDSCRYSGIIYILYEYDERNCFVLSIFGLSNTWSGLPCSSIYPSSMNMT